MMEMPEGWKKLEDYAKSKPILRHYGFGTEKNYQKEDVNLIEVINLMREMAEVLEKIQHGADRRFIGIVPNRCPQCVSAERADEILKKFQEWK